MFAPAFLLALHFGALSPDLAARHTGWLLGQTESVAASEEAAAPAAVAAPQAAVNPAPVSTEPPPVRYRREKSFNVFLGFFEFFLGALAGYAWIPAGFVLNSPLHGGGGLSMPPDLADIMYLGVIPAALAGGVAWLIGLLDLSQRGFFTSLLAAMIGAAIGEAGGLAIGILVGNILLASRPDAGILASLLSIAIAPGFAALSAMMVMEIFKGGREVPIEPTVSLAPTLNGTLAAGPGFVGRF